MKTSYIFPVGLVIVLLILGGVYIFKSQKTSTSYPTPLVSEQATSTSAVAATYTMTDVAAHSGKGSCWTTISGSVYDLTSWISQHPGGEGAILSICGKDGTQAFLGQHGGQSRPEQMLATFKIGVLGS